MSAAETPSCFLFYQLESFLFDYVSLFTLVFPRLTDSVAFHFPRAFSLLSDLLFPFNLFKKFFDLCFFLITKKEPGFWGISF